MFENIKAWLFNFIVGEITLADVHPESPMAEKLRKKQEQEECLRLNTVREVNALRTDYLEVYPKPVLHKIENQ